MTLQGQTATPKHHAAGGKRSRPFSAVVRHGGAPGTGFSTNAAMAGILYRNQAAQKHLSNIIAPLQQAQATVGSGNMADAQNNNSTALLSSAALSQSGHQIRHQNHSNSSKGKLNGATAIQSVQGESINFFSPTSVRAGIKGGRAPNQTFQRPFSTGQTKPQMLSATLQTASGTGQATSIKQGARQVSKPMSATAHRPLSSKYQRGGGGVGPRLLSGNQQRLRKHFEPLLYRNQQQSATQVHELLSPDGVLRPCNAVGSDSSPSDPALAIASASQQKLAALAAKHQLECQPAQVVQKIRLAHIGSGGGHQGRIDGKEVLQIETLVAKATSSGRELEPSSGTTKRASLKENFIKVHHYQHQRHQTKSVTSGSQLSSKARGVREKSSRATPGARTLSHQSNKAQGSTIQPSSHETTNKGGHLTLTLNSSHLLQNEVLRKSLQNSTLHNSLAINQHSSQHTILSDGKCHTASAKQQPLNQPHAQAETISIAAKFLHERTSVETIQARFLTPTPNEVAESGQQAAKRDSAKHLMTAEEIVIQEEESVCHQTEPSPNRISPSSAMQTAQKLIGSPPFVNSFQTERPDGVQIEDESVSDQQLKTDSAGRGGPLTLDQNMPQVSDQGILSGGSGVDEQKYYQQLTYGAHNMRPTITDRKEALRHQLLQQAIHEINSQAPLLAANSQMHTLLRKHATNGQISWNAKHRLEAMESCGVQTQSLRQSQQIQRRMAANLGLSKDQDLGTSRAKKRLLQSTHFLNPSDIVRNSFAAVSGAGDLTEMERLQEQARIHKGNNIALSSQFSFERAQEQGATQKRRKGTQSKGAKRRHQQERIQTSHERWQQSVRGDFPLESEKPVKQHTMKRYVKTNKNKLHVARSKQQTTTYTQQKLSSQLAITQCRIAAKGAPGSGRPPSCEDLLKEGVVTVDQQKLHYQVVDADHQLQRLSPKSSIVTSIPMAVVPNSVTTINSDSRARVHSIDMIDFNMAEDGQPSHIQAYNSANLQTPLATFANPNDLLTSPQTANQSLAPASPVQKQRLLNGVGPVGGKQSSDMLIMSQRLVQQGFYPGKAQSPNSELQVLSQTSAPRNAANTAMMASSLHQPSHVPHPTFYSHNNLLSLSSNIVQTEPIVPTTTVAKPSEMVEDSTLGDAPTHLINKANAETGLSQQQRRQGDERVYTGHKVQHTALSSTKAQRRTVHLSQEWLKGSGSGVEQKAMSRKNTNQGPGLGEADLADPKFAAKIEFPQNTTKPKIDTNLAQNQLDLSSSIEGENRGIYYPATTKHGVNLPKKLAQTHDNLREDSRNTSTRRPKSQFEMRQKGDDLTQQANHHQVDPLNLEYEELEKASMGSIYFSRGERNKERRGRGQFRAQLVSTSAGFGGAAASRKKKAQHFVEVQDFAQAATGVAGGAEDTGAGKKGNETVGPSLFNQPKRSRDLHPQYKRASQNSRHSQQQHGATAGQQAVPQTDQQPLGNKAPQAPSGQKSSGLKTTQMSASKILNKVVTKQNSASIKNYSIVGVKDGSFVVEKPQPVVIPIAVSTTKSSHLQPSLQQFLQQPTSSNIKKRKLSVHNIEFQGRAGSKRDFHAIISEKRAQSRVATEHLNEGHSDKQLHNLSHLNPASDEHFSKEDGCKDLPTQDHRKIGQQQPLLEVRQLVDLQSSCFTFAEHEGSLLVTGQHAVNLDLSKVDGSRNKTYVEGPSAQTQRAKALLTQGVQASHDTIRVDGSLSM